MVVYYRKNFGCTPVTMVIAGVFVDSGKEEAVIWKKIKRD
jgi:hypothetical protein